MDKITIGSRLIGKEEPVFVIAEIGSNHDGGLDQARELIGASAKAGADAVKFQSFTAERLLNRKTMENGAWVDDPAYPVLEKLELPEEWHKELLDCAKSHGVAFLSTPFDERRADLLQSLGVEAFKIASGDLTHTGLIRHIARFGKPVLLSTGAAFIEEIEEAVRTVREEGNTEIVLLHCTSEYPARLEDCNLRAISSVEGKFCLPVGLSDHSRSATIPLAAVALGACVVEKHVTLDRDLTGPDHSFAFTVNELGAMIDEIRNLEKALGTGIKEPLGREVSERRGARRSIYAKTHIKKGDLFTEDNLKIVRHNFGMAPDRMEGLIGRQANRNIEKDELIMADAL